MADDPQLDDQQAVDLLEQVWGSLDEACTGLSEEQWKMPTDLPGWSVQDNLAHISAIESSILGRPAPDHTPPEYDHVKNEVGQRNEVWVDARRSWSGADVLAEFREVTGARLAQLRGFSEAEFSADSWTPAGPGTVRDLLPFRAFDSWAHEQDIRRALDRPGDLDGPVADFALKRVVGALPFVVGKKVHPPDGTTVVFEVSGSWPTTVAIGVQDGRAKTLAEVPEDATATLAMDAEAFACLGLGRWNRETAEERGMVSVRGDDALGRSVLDQMNFLF
jgi:uncharacterized protein (TIGR03083 family)